MSHANSFKDLIVHPVKYVFYFRWVVLFK